MYANLILDAKSLAGGGWVILRAADARRVPPCDPTVFGCPLTKRPYGILERLDADGRVVAQEHGAEPFGLVHVIVFEAQGVVVGEGQSRGQTLHAFRLASLDGIASDVATCIKSNDTCISYRKDYQSGLTILEERDPRDLHVVRSFASVTTVAQVPAIFPAANVVLVMAPTRPFVDAVALDPTRPMTLSWRQRLSGACGVERVADDRALVAFGPSDCQSSDVGWHDELIEVSTGRVLRMLDPRSGLSGNALSAVEPTMIVADTGIAIDPREGADGPVVAGPTATYLDWDRGIAVVSLSDGGAAVLERRTASPQLHDLSFTTVGQGTCAEYLFPRVMNATSANVRCAAIAVSAGPDRLLVATGSAASQPASFTVTHVRADVALRTIDITYRPNGRRQAVSDPTPTAIIDVPDAPAGDWLVRLYAEGGDLPYGYAFVVRFP